MKAEQRETLERLSRRRPVDLPVAIVSAHPDDETIGAGASLRLFRRLLLVTMTDGAPRNAEDAQRAGFATREAYADARRRELRSALAEGGALYEIVELGAVDQEASRQLARLARELEAVLSARGIQLVITHPYEGGHPDHDAAAFAAHAASAALGTPIIEMTFYHAGPEGELETGRFLANGGGETVIDLTPEESALKQAMLDCFETQKAVLAAFRPETERFRPAPVYDFTAPPHPGRLYYEHFRWGVTGQEWRDLTAAALNEIGRGQ